MTLNGNFKRRVRARAAKTGESYTAAFHHIRQPSAKLAGDCRHRQASPFLRLRQSIITGQATPRPCRQARRSRSPARSAIRAREAIFA
ncbi:hypothetical protein CN934_30225 [Ensifer sp. MMN_5]|nr:hypothetical protein CN934_30225 [Ensifer sp. MMN_5]PND24324.1 hypothetical protein CN933_28145 [Sinorhizobium sp. M4_45]